MKIDRTINYKLFKYNLLHLQIYSKIPCITTTDFSINFLEHVEIYLKQILKIIYNYHIHCFKILFIDFPIVSKVKQKKLVHFTNHNFIMGKSWINGTIKNRFSILTYLKTIQSSPLTKNYQLLWTIKKKPHLVVIFNPKIDFNALNEFYTAGIPLIVFNWNLINNFKNSYKTLGNYNFIEKNVKLTFFLLFYSLLKKTPIIKKTKSTKSNKSQSKRKKNVHLKSKKKNQKNFS